MKPFFSTPQTNRTSLLGLAAALVEGRASSTSRQATDTATAPDTGDASARPALHVSDDLRQLLGIGADGEMRPGSDTEDAARSGDEAAAGGEDFGPLRPRREAAAQASAFGVPSATARPVQNPDPGYDPTKDSWDEIAQRYATVWHSAAVRGQPDRGALMRAWARDVTVALRDGAANVRGIDDVGSTFEAMGAAFELLEQRLAAARARLVGGDAALAGRLAEARVHHSEVNVYLDRFVDNITRLLCEQARTTRPITWLVPSADALVRQAVHDARQARHTTTTTSTAPNPTSALTAASTTAVTPAPVSNEAGVVVSGGMQLEGFPTIRNREEALQAIRDFDRNRLERLPQFDGFREDLTALSEGRVTFRNIQDMAIAVPCALSIRMNPDNFGNRMRYRYVGTYPPNGPARSSVTQPMLFGMRALVTTARDNSNRVLVSPDSQMLIPTNIYTDPVVEDAKRLMWWSIRMAANIRTGRPRPGGNG